MNKPLTAADVKGGWICYEITRDYSSFSEQVQSNLNKLVETESTYSHWFFTDDSIFEFVYPCRLYEKNSFRIRSDSILYDRSNVCYYHIRLKNDSMTLTSAGNRNVPAYVKKLVRTTLDKNIVNKLKITYVNLDCYPAKMKIKREIVSKSGTVQHLTFPVKMPEYIYIPNKQTAQKADDGQITLIIDGKEREFSCSPPGWYKSKKDPKRKGKLIWEQKTHVILTPKRSWWTGEAFEVIYQQE